MRLDLDQKDLVCLVLGSYPSEVRDAQYLQESGFMKITGGKFGNPEFTWKRDAIENLSDVALYGLYILIKRGNIRSHYQRFNEAAKRRG